MIKNRDSLSGYDKKHSRFSLSFIGFIIVIVLTSSTASRNKVAFSVINSPLLRSAYKYSGLFEPKRLRCSSTLKFPKFLQRRDGYRNIFGIKMVSESDSSKSLSDTLYDAMAALTESSSSLLGIKSIGVDYGLVRTGLAINIGYDSKPLIIVSDTNATQVSLEVVKWVHLEGASRVILGLPTHKNGSIAEQTIITREFAETLFSSLYSQFGPEVSLFMWDERYTSKEAWARARAANPTANLYKQLDADAACIILDDYYKHEGKEAEKIEMPEDPKKRDTIECTWIEYKKEKKRERKAYKENQRLNFKSNQMAVERAKLFNKQSAKRNEGEIDTVKKKKKRKKKR